MGNRPHIKDTLCRYCKNAKDHYNGKGAEACYCTQYGIIVARQKRECNGFRHLGGIADDGNITGSNGRDS